MKDPLLLIAREAIHDRITGRNAYRPLAGGAGRPPLGCFVSLKLRERLRGCMGTMEPTRPTLEEEVAANALAAALRDPRFKPLRPEELERVAISIDLLTPLEPVASEAELDVSRFGVMVHAGSKKGLLLPDLPGVRTVRQQIDICREKAGIAAGEEVSLERFEVERIEE